MTGDGGHAAVEAARLLLGLAVLLLAARSLGELAQRWGQPSVLGELLAGIFLGPTLLGVGVNLARRRTEARAARLPPATGR